MTIFKTTETNSNVNTNTDVLIQTIDTKEVTIVGNNIKLNNIVVENDGSLILRKYIKIPSLASAPTTTANILYADDIGDLMWGSKNVLIEDDSINVGNVDITGTLDVSGQVSFSSRLFNIGGQPYTWPEDGGENNQVLSTDGDGVIFWSDINTGANNLSELNDTTISSVAENDLLQVNTISGQLKWVNTKNISGLTINNSTIGITTPLAGKFTTLTANSISVVNSISVDDDILITGDATISSNLNVSGITTFGSYLNIFEASNEANPTISLGSSSNEAFVIQTIYDSESQTLDKITFTTKAVSATADKGKMEFYVDESLIMSINDDAINLANGKQYEINGINVLNSTTLGTGIITSSLTTVGILDSGSISSNFGNIDIGTSTISSGDISINGSITDSNDNEILSITSTTNAVNEFTIANSITGNNPIISSTGDDTNIGLNFQVKGTGTYNFLSTSTTATKLNFYENTDNGTNTITLKAPDSITTSITLTLPDNDGDANQILKTDGNGILSWTDQSESILIANDANNRLVTATGSSGLNGEANLTFDGSILNITGDISINGSITDSNDNEILSITPTTNAVNEFTIANSITGNNPIISSTGDDTNIGLNFQVKGTGTYNFLSTSTTATKLNFYENTDNGTNTITLKAPDSITTSITLTLPDNDGDANQILKTDGNGILSWTNQSGSISIANDANNRLITATGSSGLNGEANLTFDGSILDITGSITASGGITVGTDGVGADIRFYSATEGDSFLWDASEEKLVLTGTSDQNALEIADGHVNLTDNSELRIGTGNDITILHNETNSIITSNTGDLIVDNTSTTGSTILRLGTDTNATDFQIQNNSETAIMTVFGDGNITTNLADDDSTAWTIGSTGLTNLINIDTTNLFEKVTVNGNLDATGNVAITGNLTVSGVSSFRLVRTLVNSSAYVIQPTDTIIGVTYTTTGSVVLTLPTASSAGEGKIYYIKDEGNNAGINGITINRANADDRIDKLEAYVLLGSNSLSVSIYSDGGSDWFIFSNATRDSGETFILLS